MQRVMIVDDDPDILMLMRVLIEMAPDLCVVAEATNGTDALARWRELDPPPEVVILDYSMPDLSGLDVAAQMLEERPRQVIVMCSTYIDDTLTARAERIGVAFCVPKREINVLPDLIETYARSA